MQQAQHAELLMQQQEQQQQQQQLAAAAEQQRRDVEAAKAAVAAAATRPFLAPPPPAAKPSVPSRRTSVALLGPAELDGILGGGVETGAITEFGWVLRCRRCIA